MSIFLLNIKYQAKISEWIKMERKQIQDKKNETKRKY